MAQAYVKPGLTIILLYDLWNPEWPSCFVNLKSNSLTQIFDFPEIWRRKNIQITCPQKSPKKILRKISKIGQIWKLLRNRCQILAGQLPHCLIHIPIMEIRDLPISPKLPFICIDVSIWAFSVQQYIKKMSYFFNKSNACFHICY